MLPILTFLPARPELPDSPEVRRYRRQGQLGEETWQHSGAAQVA